MFVLQIVLVKYSVLTGRGWRTFKRRLAEADPSERAGSSKKPNREQSMKSFIGVILVERLFVQVSFRQ